MTNPSILFLIFSLIPISLAWWENGHMLVAQVAKLDLLSKYPEVYNYAEEIALYLSPYTFGLSTTFIESAVWADDIKNTQWDFWNSWHFINRPYDTQGVFPTNDSEWDSPWAIDTTLSLLMDNSSLGNITLEKSIMMRMMMHIIGDMHQPLHNAEMFSEVFPLGDQGGNLINITWQNNTMNLHAFWDSIAVELPQFSRPLNASSLDFFENFGQELINENPRSEFANYLSIQNISIWTIEIYKYAVNYAYDLLPSDYILTSEYQDTTYQLCRELITLAGYRLSDMIYYALAAQLPNSTNIINDNDSILSTPDNHSDNLATPTVERVFLGQ